MTSPEPIADYKCHTGEGPLWNPKEQLLYWVDIPNGRLFSYDPISNAHEVVYERDGAIGGFTLQANGDLLLFEEIGRIEAWNARSGITKTIIGSIDGEEGSRFNDVIADPAGRVFCGTMPQGNSPGRLYRLETDGSLTTVETGLKIPNGLGFTPDLTQVYFSETNANSIYRYDYDQETGRISNRDEFVNTDNEDGGPDGMTVDSQGCVWSARWNGGCLVRYDESGCEISRMDFSAKKVSCPTFGGPAYTDLYVTTALTNNSRVNEGEGSGMLFRCSPGVRGLSEFYSRIEY